MNTKETRKRLKDLFYGAKWEFDEKHLNRTKSNISKMDLQ